MRPRLQVLALAAAIALTLAGGAAGTGHGLSVGDNLGVVEGPGHNDNLTVPVDLWWDEEHRRLHSRTYIATEVDDPPELALRRAGGTYPNGPVAQTQAGENLGLVHWTGHTGLAFQSRSAQVYARAAEPITQTAAGGSLHLGTTPLGAAAGPVDRLSIGPAGDLTVHTGALELPNSRPLRFRSSSGQGRRAVDLDAGDNLNLGRDDAIRDVQVFGQLVVYDDATTPAPALTVTPAGGIVFAGGARLEVSGGALYFVGSAGTRTLIAPP